MEVEYSILWVSLILGAIGLMLYKKLAIRWGIVDVPNERSSHTEVTLRGGGFVLLLTSIALFFSDGVSLLLPLSLCIGILTGFLDDRYGLSTVVRFLLYFACAALMLFGVLRLHTFDTWIWIPLFVVMLGAVNTYNFMDGINGITALYSIVFLGTVLYLFRQLGLSEYSESLLGFLGFFLVFLYYNHRKKAILFLGDAGSVSMGLLACFFVVYLGLKLDTWSPIILLGLYGVDSVGTIIIRVIKRENILQAHKSHLYQDLVHLKKLPHLKVSWIYALSQLAINALFVASISSVHHEIIVMAIFLLLAIIFASLKYSLYGRQLFSN